MAGGAQRTMGGGSPTPHVDVEAPTSRMKLSDRYVLCGEIGQGGMARVHMGRQLGSAAFARTVAIKRLLPRFAEEPDFRMMLTDEARLAARVRHPNVVQMLDVMVTDDELFLVMEYIDGVSLGRLTRKAQEAQEGTGRIPEPILAAIICHVLHGLHAAHEATDENGAPLSIVHRDVSPDNVLVGVDGLARVLDFGVAKASSRLHKTRDGEIKGKLSYMAPEQLSGRATRQSDVFSASIILWEGLVGKRLFRADDDGETIGRVLAAVVEPPLSLAPGTTPKLSEIVMRGLAREPGKRWATARDMALALEEHVTLAPASQIGAWVEGMEGPWLAERRALVRNAEASPAKDAKREAPTVTRRIDVSPFLDPAPSAAGVATDAPGAASAARPLARRRTAFWLLGIGAVAVGVAGLALAARPGTRAPLPAPALAAAPPIEPTASAPSDPPPAVSGSAAVAPPTATTSSGAKPVRSRRHGGAAPAPASGARGSDKPAANACDPPYRLGPLGEKIWLKECL